MHIGDTMTMVTHRTPDDLDRRIIDLFTQDPHIGVLGASRELGVARGTVQSRLARLADDGIITSFGPHLDPIALGYPVTAFVTLQLRQGHGREGVLERLEEIPHVLEAHTITGDGDLMIRVVARDNADMQRVIDRVLQIEHVHRSSTVIALDTKLAWRTTPLLHHRVATDT